MKSRDQIFENGGDPGMMTSDGDAEAMRLGQGLTFERASGQPQRMQETTWMSQKPGVDFAWKKDGIGCSAMPTKKLRP